MIELSEFRRAQVGLIRRECATLQAGLHPIRLTLTRSSSASGTPALQLYWKRTDGSLGPLSDQSVIPSAAFMR